MNPKYWISLSLLAIVVSLSGCGQKPQLVPNTEESKSGTKTALLPDDFLPLDDAYDDGYKIFHGDRS